MNAVRIALMSVVAPLMAFGLHYYLWTRLVRATAMPRGWSRAATAVLVGLGVWLPVGMVARRVFLETTPPWVWPSYLWVGVALYLLIAVAGADLGRVVVRALRRWGPAASEPPADPQRRIVLARWVAGGAVLSAAGLAGLGLENALQGPAVKHVRIALARLPRELSGTTIAQITDLHVGQLIGRDYVQHVVKQTNALGADLIVITGDLVDSPPALIGRAVAELGALRAPQGVYFVTGNHEYYAGVLPWLPFLRDIGIRVLRNERVSIGGEGAAGFDLAGIDDIQGSRFEDGHGADLAAALAGRDPARELVLLAHQPKAVYAAREAGVGLQLSGHTHGGQLWPLTWGAHLVFPVVHGLERFGATQIYVSRGTGWIGPPMRLGAPSELTLVELVRDESAALITPA